MEEIYRTIVGYKKYEVSNFGNVRNIKFNRILKPGVDTNGYYIVILYNLGKRTTRKIHKLVAPIFLENPDDKKCVDHIDNNRFNNHVSNLRYATHAENSQNRQIANNNTSGSKGVNYNKNTQKWHARIMIDGIRVHLGLFENKEDAKQARVIKANQAFGIFTNACEKINEI